MGSKALCKSFISVGAHCFLIKSAVGGSDMYTPKIFLHAELGEMGQEEECTIIAHRSPAKFTLNF